MLGEYFGRRRRRGGGVAVDLFNMRNSATPKRPPLIDLSNVVVPRGYRLVKEVGGHQFGAGGAPRGLTRFSICQASPTSAAAAKERAQRRVGAAAERDRADRAVAHWQALQADPTGAARAELEASYVPKSPISPLARTRTVAAVQEKPVLSPKPTRREVAHILGVTDEAFAAAQKRIQRREHGSASIFGEIQVNGRQIGTAQERSMLALYAREMSSSRIAPTRRSLGIIMQKMLQLRSEITASSSTAPPLNDHEKAALAHGNGDNTHPGGFSKAFWRQFEADFDIGLRVIRHQDIGRTKNFTDTTCAAHFLRLDETLDEMGFLYVKGERRGHIRDECMFFG